MKKLAARVDIVEKELGKVKFVSRLSAASLMTLLVAGLIMQNKETLHKHVPTSLKNAFDKKMKAVGNWWKSGPKPKAPDAGPNTDDKKI